MRQWSREKPRSCSRQQGMASWLARDRTMVSSSSCKRGVKINLFDTGKFSFGGPKSDFKSEVEDFVQTGPVRAVTDGDTVFCWQG